MNCLKKFLGEKSNAIDETLFSSLFEIAMNNSLCIIKTKLPIPRQEANSVHTHDHFEFTIPLSHDPKLLVEGKDFILPRRSIIPSNPGQAHGVAETAHLHHLMAFQLDCHYLQATAFSVFRKNNIEFKNTYAPFDNYLEKMLELFLYESHNRQAGHEFILDYLSSMITIYLLRTLSSNLILQEKLSRLSGKKEIARAVDFLYDNYNQEFSLEKVAAAADLSKYHFIRVFKQETGKTPYHFFVDIKIEKAIELMKTRKYSVTEVCFMCGFKSHSHFSRLFNMKMGIVPSRFMRLFM